jgi:hypothetical protein
VSASVSLSLYLCPRHWVDVVATWRVLGVHQHATDDVPSPSAYPLDSLSLAKTLDSSKERLRDQVVSGGCWRWGRHPEKEGEGKLLSWVNRPSDWA